MSSRKIAYAVRVSTREVTAVDNFPWIFQACEVPTD